MARRCRGPRHIPSVRFEDDICFLQSHLSDVFLILNT
ncbi:hypothetical protein PVAP13_6NG242103 [Panicum virgatum]|uniref:Uncharacterized protein n=1 Tax=Panicum virgatum TaxID=38727 RepID=A0A8T0R2H8_PANVG|nr:hypothetical protein PVAP13_6NG242103 [Panicum virgatum]